MKAAVLKLYRKRSTDVVVSNGKLQLHDQLQGSYIKKMRISKCESRFIMRVRCRRWQLFVLVPVLAVLSVVTNLAVFVKHSKVAFNLHADADYGDERNKPVSVHIVSEKRSEAEGIFPMNKRKIKRKRKMRIKKKEVSNKVDPNPLSMAPNTTFSACLLIKDDNEILNEWLAYHYHAINLRHLIIAVDPSSSQSPSQILQKWRLLTDLEVSEWTDSTFMPQDFLDNGRPPAEYIMDNLTDSKNTLSLTDLMEISNHRYRQRVFLAQCMKSMRQQKQSWVMHIDTDEYVVASKLLRQMNPDYLDVPPMSTPGSVLSLIQQVVNKNPQQVSYPCISMLRVLFGSVESPSELRSRHAPAGFNATRFDTLRFRHHASPRNKTSHGHAKVILDVSAIPDRDFPDDLVYSIHRPVERFCLKHKELAFTNFRQQPIAVNHYLGSWERYNARSDKRRSRQIYDAKANVGRGQDDGVRLWLQGFVESMGRETVVSLLGKAYLDG